MEQLPVTTEMMTIQSLFRVTMICYSEVHTGILTLTMPFLSQPSTNTGYNSKNNSDTTAKTFH